MRSTTYVNAHLKHIFQNLPIGGMGDSTGVRGSLVAGDFFLSMHVADPGSSGNQSTSEPTYSGYARKAVPRDAANWSVVGEAAKNVNQIVMNECTSGSATITHVGIGIASTGTGVLLYRCPLATYRAVSPGITPRIDANQLTVTEYADPV